MGEIIGYARACLNDQNLSRQTNELKELGCKQIFYDKLSGTNNKLNGLNECIEALQPTDTLVVWRLDCLSKSISHLVSLINQLRKRGVHFKSIHDAVIDTRTPSGELIFEIFAVLSQVDQTLFTEMSLNRFKSANTSIDKPPYRWRRQRVFISSTFRDMHAERDYLVKYVFPDLRLWCEQYKIHLVDIDLRWGVTAAEVQSGKVIDICMEQIEGSRPFFICILGDRYGWVPSDDEIPESTVSTYEYLRHKKGFSVTHLEIHHAVLSSLKSFDSLEELPLSFFYFRKGLPSPKSIQGFTAKDESAYARTFFESDQKNSIKLNQLKEQILEHYKKIGRIKDNPYEVEEHIFNYTPTFDPSLQNPEDNKLKGRLTKASLREFGDRVKRDLQKAIAYQYHVRIEALSETHEENTLETELDLHEAFIENRVRLFIGRTELLQKLHAYVEGASNSILAIYGPPGCGKSSLLAKFYVELVESEYSQLSIASNQIIIPHFIGASPRSTSLQNLLKRMCGEIKKLSNIDEKIPSDTNKLSIAFNSLLAKAKNRVIIIIDGLNQLDGFNNSYDFKWLPSHLPKNVKIIVSTLEGDTKNTLEIKTKNRLFVSLLQDIERREIIKGMPSLFSKTLDDQHIDAILARDETRNPLFLKIALDELRLFGSFENIEKKIREFPGTIEELFQDVLTRLEIDHGKNNVERFFCLLECSRYGLTGKELNDLLSDDEEKNHIVILRQVRDFFHNRGELIDFFHRGLSKAIRIKYLDGHRNSQLCNGKNSTQYWHNLLAKYFMAQPLFLDDERVKTINSRKCSEQPWHLINSNRWEEVNGTLCDLVFIDAKIRAGFVHDLQEDYLRALQNDRQSEANDEIKLFYYTLIQNLDLIQSYPDYSFQWLFNSLWWKGDVCLEKLHKAKETYIKSGNSFLRQYRIPKKIEKRYFQHSIQKLSTGMACTFLFDGKKLISCSDDKTVKLMDALTGKELSSVQGKKKFTGPAGTIKMCAISPDGKRVIAILKDDSKNIKLWDSESGKEILTLRGHRHSIESLAFSPNGRKAASGGGKDDKTLRIWDIDLGKELVAIFDEHTSAINSCVFSPDGKWLLTSGHRALDLWDVQTGKKIVSLFGKQRIIEGFTFCSFSPDGKTIVSVSKKAMRLWDVETGTEIGNVNHRQNITRCAASPNSKTIVTISDNTTLMLWNYFTDKEAKFSGAGKIETEHTDKITTCAFSPDGRRIVSGGNDKVLITYDVKTGIKVSSFTEHADSIVSCRFLPDGTKVASVSSDSLVKIWDAATGKEIRTAMGQSQFYSKLVFCKFSPDGKLIASIDNRPCKTTIELWEALSGSRIISFPVNAKEVSDCDFSSDGNKIVFTSDKTIQLWNLGTGQEITTFSGHAEITKTCSFSPDGSRILSGSDDTTLKLWDAETGRELALFRGHTDKVQSCAFSPDGSRILSGSDDTTLKLWDAETRKEIISFCGHTGKIKMCAFSPNGKQIASIDNETLRLWDIHTGKDIKSFIGNYEANNCVFSPDGKIIIAGGHLWDIENTVENAIETASFAGHKSAVRMCTFSQDAKTMFSFAYGDTFKLWDTVSGREIAAFSGYPGAIKDCKVSPDSKKVLFSSESDDLKLWDIGNGREIASLPGTCNTEKFAFSPNSERIVTDCSEYVFKLWDADSGREIASLSSSLKVKAFAFSPDSNLIVFGGYDGKVYLWKATTDCRMFELMEQHEGPITSVAFSPDSKIIVSGGFDNTLMVRDAEKNYVITTFTGHAYQVKDCSFSPDGNTILSISDVDKVQKLWNAKNGREIASFVGDSDNTAFGSFSPDGKTFFLDSSHTLCLRDTQTGDEIFKLNGPANYKCIFSPDGKMIIGYGYGLMLWDSQTGKRIAFFHNSSRIAPLDISFCGNFIACGDYAGNMYLLALEGFINLAGNTEKSPTSDFPKNMAYNLIHKKTCYYELGFTEVINQGKYCEPVCKTETGKSEFLELASDMSFLVIGNKNQFEVWNIKSIPELMFKRNTDQPFIKIKISTDNKKIITIDDNYQLVSHNINKGTIETSYRYSTQRGTADKRYDFRDKDKVTKLNYAEKLAEIVPQRRNFIAFTKDYKHSLIWDTDRHPNLFFCDLDSGHTLLTTKENANEISFVSLTQDSRFSISVDADSKVNVWDMESGRIIQSLQNIGNNYLIPDWKHICPSKFQINPDGKHIITPNQTMEILTGSINSTILWSGSGEMGCFSNDGRYAYLIKNDNSVLIWNIKAGGDLCIAMGKKYTFHWTVTDRGKKINKSHEVERTISEDVLKRQSKVISLSGHTSKIKGIRISADDRIIITLSEDGSVRVWESCSGRCIYVFRIWAENISKMCNYNQFYYGDRYGKYRLMTLPNYTCDFAITTAIRSWQPKYRAWDTLLKYYCYWCGGIFTLEENFCKLMKHFEKRYNIKKKDSPSLRLPNEAWDDPNLMSKCPQCNRPLKFNPFVVDNISSSFRKTLLQKLGI